MVDSETPLPNNSLNEQNPQRTDQILEFCCFAESDCEYVEQLIKKEDNFQLIKNETGWFKSTRLDVIKWILDTRTFFGFQSRTAYLSLIYFDRFFSKRNIDDGDLLGVRITSAACLSLAVKIEERRKALPLSKYRVGGYNLEGNAIREKELLILSTLEWKMICVTPFAYLHYFVTKFFGNSGVEEMIAQAVDFIFAAMGEINAAEQRPSIVAAAAVLAAYDHQLTKKSLEIKMNAVTTWGSLEKEHMLSCYKLMQGIVIEI